MNVTVHYLAQMKRAAGCASETVELRDAADLQELLVCLAARHAPSLRLLLLDEASQPRKSLLFFVGEEHAGPAHPLRDGDAVSILAPMAGG
jgi:molybdopterin converting factor small subunit